MVFKFVDGVSPSTEVSSLWSANSSSHSEDALDVTATHRQHYINSIVKNWETFDPKEVRSEGIKDCQIIFNNSWLLLWRNILLEFRCHLIALQTLELSNPSGWGRQKKANPPSSVNAATFFIDCTRRFKHFNVPFFVSSNVFLCNNARILIKTSRRDDIHQFMVLVLI